MLTLRQNNLIDSYVASSVLKYKTLFHALIYLCFDGLFYKNSIKAKGVVTAALTGMNKCAYSVIKKIK